MIKFSYKSRSKEAEILDDHDLHGNELATMLNDLERVNRLLGGYAITLEGIKDLLKHIPKDKELVILDIGCGDGAMLRYLSKELNTIAQSVQFIGIDANAHIIALAKSRSVNYSNISFKVCTVEQLHLLPIEYDIALCTLFLHHFRDKAITEVLKELSLSSKVGVVVNDLDRNPFAFWLFKLLSAIFIKSKIARHDGQVSIARGFVRKELKNYTSKLPQVKSTVRWRWAFRWLLVLQKN